MYYDPLDHRNISDVEVQEKATMERHVPLGFPTGSDHYQTPSELDTEASWSPHEKTSNYFSNSFAPETSGEGTSPDRLGVVRKFLSTAVCDLSDAAMHLLYQNLVACLH